MCGIFAVLGLPENSSKLRQTVLALSKKLRHRGPDWNGIHCAANAILAHERLAIVGLHSGAQPISNRRGDISLSVNGEIYNYVDLEASLGKRNEVAGDRSNDLSPLPKCRSPRGTDDEFTTDSDCEVLLHLYRKHGADFLCHTFVNGMYAFVLYDEAEDRFVAARDPVGIIPLYVGWDGNGAVWFASELKALQDVCDHVETFPPGHYCVGRSLHHDNCDNDSNEVFQTKPFYTERWFVDHEHVPTNALVLTELRQHLTAAVRRHLLSEVPYGLLLSGGLDSSLIASIACREYGRLGNADVLRSFCIGLEGSPDIAAAEMVARHIGSRHYSFHFTVQQGLDALADVIYHLETFDVTTVRASTPMFLLARRIKATGCKMVLSGEGADEVFGGYLYFHKAPNKEELHKETVRKVKDLHKFDCLRANKSMMAWGVEARVPFLDRQFLEYAMELDPAVKMCSNSENANIEKAVLRRAFDDPDDPYLPLEVLWRQKEQFSDGVGYGWIDALRAEADSRVTDTQMRFAANRFQISPPTTKEAYMYREIFARAFPSPSAAKTVPSTGQRSVACSTPAALLWHESFRSSPADPSGRAVDVHTQAYS